MRKAILICMFLFGFAALAQDAPKESAEKKLLIENAQLKLQLANLKEMLLTAQFQLAEIEKQQAQAALDAAQKSEPVKQEKR